MRKFEIYRRQLLNEIDESVDDKKTLKGLLRKNVYDIEVLIDVFEAMRLVYKVDEQQARRVNDFIKHLTIVQSTNEALSLAERDKFYNLEEKSLFFASRYDFDSCFDKARRILFCRIVSLFMTHSSLNSHSCFNANAKRGQVSS